MSPEEAEDAALGAEDLGNGGGVHELHHPVAGGGGQHAVRRQTQVQVLPPQQLVHQRDDLTNDKSINNVFFYVPYSIPHGLICRPSDSTMLEDTGMEPRTVATLALEVRRSNHFC